MTRKVTESQLQVPGEVPGGLSKEGPRFQKGGAPFPVLPPVPRRRATRSAHPGVVLMKPDSRNPTWRARCEGPDSGKRVKVRLDPMGAGRNAQTRRLWAIERA